MISKLPQWVWAGGSALAFIAGMINAVGFLGVGHEALTHLTGTATASSIALSGGDWLHFLHLLSVVAAFFSGSVISGFIIRQSALRLGRRYGMALAVESLLIFLAIPLLNRGIHFGDYFAACACGLQNAMASSYSGAVIRTTHISGIVTDLGIILGHWARGLTPDGKRVWLYLALLGGFFMGGMIGAVLFRLLGYDALYVPAVLTGATGVIYSIHREWTRK